MTVDFKKDKWCLKKPLINISYNGTVAKCPSAVSSYSRKQFSGLNLCPSEKAASCSYWRGSFYGHYLDKKGKKDIGENLKPVFRRKIKENHICDAQTGILLC
ncbi:MAG: hypothetical protein JW991_00325 [Candidatus Pacebacteria bacterium]|nr:hypothetical protein [Candidatus Paceibacterota bacterium]